MKKAFFALAISAVILISACSDYAVPTNKAKQIAPDRVFAPAAKFLQPCGSCGTLIVKRDAGALTNSGRAILVYLDETKVTKLWPGEKVKLNVPPGFHHLYAFAPKPTNPIAGFMIKTGHSTTYRLTMGMFSDVRFVQSGK
jgi:hypothetical protein